MKKTNLAGSRIQLRHAVWGTVVLATVAGAVSYHARILHECVARLSFECPMRMQALWGRANQYASNQGRFPPGLDFFIEGYTFTSGKERLRLHPLLCPGSRTKVTRVQTTEELSDYYYVNWSKWFSSSDVVPGSFPLFYDRRSANHLGKGVYVVLCDGTVFWDAGGSWLIAFATNHPQYHIRLPDSGTGRKGL